MDPFPMDFDDKEENKEMTDDDDFTDMTPEYLLLDIDYSYTSFRHILDDRMLIRS